MIQNPLSVGLGDQVEDVPGWMVTAHVEKIPVTEDEVHAIGDLTMIDLLRAE